MIWDTFLFHDELDMLECRLATLDEVVDRFVLVEGDVTNLGDPKPSHYLENRERFEPWADRIVNVWATGLPASGWDVEYAKRERIAEGLDRARASDLILLSDVDEIPHPEAVRYAKAYKPDGFVRFSHRLYCFAVDWLHPSPWIGTIGASYRSVGSIQAMRELRHPSGGIHPEIQDNWHFTWIGGTERNWSKMNSSHDPEGQRGEISEGLADGNRFLRDGIYIGGVPLQPVEVDETWPRYIHERRCPPEWFRGNYREEAA